MPIYSTGLTRDFAAPVVPSSERPKVVIDQEPPPVFVCAPQTDAYPGGMPRPSPIIECRPGAEVVASVSVPPALAPLVPPSPASDPVVQNEFMSAARAWAQEHSLVLDLPPDASLQDVVQWLSGAGYPDIVGLLDRMYQRANTSFLSVAHSWAEANLVPWIPPADASMVDVLKWLFSQGYPGAGGPASLSA